MGKPKDDGMASLTVMLLTISFVHLFCISPLQVMILYDKTDPFSWIIKHRWQAMVIFRWAIVAGLYNANHAVNFLFYLASGRQFRQTFWQMLVRFRTSKLCQIIYNLY